MAGKEIHIKAMGVGRASVVVDGLDLAYAVREYEIMHRVGDRPTVVLHLNTHPDFDGVAEVRIGQVVHDALVHLGWTPPPEG